MQPRSRAALPAYRCSSIPERAAGGKHACEHERGTDPCERQGGLPGQGRYWRALLERRCGFAVSAGRNYFSRLGSTSRSIASASRNIFSVASQPTQPSVTEQP